MKDTSTKRGLWMLKSILVVLAAVVVLMATVYHRAGSGAASAAPEEYKIEIPNGLPADLWQELIPKDNPMTAAKVALGEKLYFDKRLSADRTVSCATCHDPAMALADGVDVGVGIRNQKGARNSPTVLNSMFNELQFWDGRAPTLEEQAKLPLINPLEMGMKDHPAVVARVRELPEYAPLFREAFGSPTITIDAIAKAIASFERTQLSGDAPFDRFIAGDQNAISESAKRGWDLYNGKARCISCHTWNPSSPFFSDFKFHNIGVAAKDRDFTELAHRAQRLIMSGRNREQVVDELALSAGFSELGRYLVTGQTRDIGSFKTSMLRDIELTAPYMHNGSEKTLLDVVKFYDKGGEINPNLDGGMRPLKLTDPEMNDLVEFMKTLTSDSVRRKVQNTKPQTREPGR